jgi:hypothetical protein
MRPPLLELGDYTKFRRYEAEFDELYQGADSRIRTPLGYEVIFPAKAVDMYVLARRECDTVYRRTGIKVGRLEYLG